MLKVPKQAAMPKINRLAQSTYGGGLNEQEINTLSRQELSAATNIFYTTNGDLKSRPQFVEWDLPELPGTQFSDIVSFGLSATGKRTLIVVTCDILVLKVWAFYDGDTTWTKIGADIGLVADFGLSSDNAELVQQNGKVLAAMTSNVMCFAVDTTDRSLELPLFYLPKSTGTLMLATAALTKPLAPTLSSSFAGKYSAFYILTYLTETGETEASEPASISVDWAALTGTMTSNVTLTFAAPPTGERMRIYRCIAPSDVIKPELTNYGMLAELTTGTTFMDNGQATVQVLSPPSENSTGGIYAHYIKEINSRIWAFGKDNIVRYSDTAPAASGIPKFTGNGAGFFYVAYGSEWYPTVITHGRADDGQICSFVLGENYDHSPSGRRFNIFSLETSYADSKIFSFYPSEQRGDEGVCTSGTAADFMNSMLYLSEDTFRSTGLRATYTGNNITANISEKLAKIPRLNRRLHPTTAVYDDIILWDITPSDIYAFFPTVGTGVWSKISVDHDWMGMIWGRFCIIKSGKFFYMDDTATASDSFNVNNPLVIKSGLVKANPDDGREWVRLLNTIFSFSNAFGEIEITISCNTRRRIETYRGKVNLSVISGQETIAFTPLEFSEGEETRGGFSTGRSWSGTVSVAKSADSYGLVEVGFKINKDVNWWLWEIRSGGTLRKLVLDSVVTEFVDIGVGLDFSNRYNLTNVQKER